MGGDDIWYRPTRKEAAYLEFVMRDEPEPPKHRCGICNNGTGVLNPNCPNAAR